MFKVVTTIEYDHAKCNENVKYKMGDRTMGYEKLKNECVLLDLQYVYLPKDLDNKTCRMQVGPS